MRFVKPLLPGTLVRRYKRFFADVALADGTVVVAHCANPGSMLSCLPEGARIWLSESADPKRKLKFTWQLLEAEGGWVMVNPSAANLLVAEALALGQIPALAGYAGRTREVSFGAQSRIDFLLHPADWVVTKQAHTAGTGLCWVEVKNATYSLGAGRLAFPDSVTERGTRHLQELIAARKAGARAVLLFHAGRSNAVSVEPAHAIDRVYGETLRQARESGVELLAHRLVVECDAGCPIGMSLGDTVPVVLG